ncbi:YqcI/YcgG family protein [Bacillus sp. ISL-41]|uniref:YqcI/YcgG family protein n=1 Tax=Bacillus sp. ISL-41 TaxID=2819127 RepID=UPI001BED25B9|nr:YqcI/YcgG family protein [Bacillus sp. ISL-41]MBT2642255.1 YqcI/YcgG family protein [Bacillus sp. ISL-41]
MTGLYTHGSSPLGELKDWEKQALEKFFAKMSDKEKPFPCIPATIGFSMNQLRYGFVGNPKRETTINELASLLTSYSKHSREIGKYTSLIIFYETTESMKDVPVKEYEQIFWEHLSGLTALDETEWPEDIPQDPHNPIWEFCFNGEKYFMYCATPAHKNRKSRHFDVMMLAITPRWVLQEFNKSQEYAQRIKAQVRKRLANYDTISIHPDLNTYGAEDNFEWRQYFLRDDDSSLSKCPYHRVLKFLGFDK